MHRSVGRFYIHYSNLLMRMGDWAVAPRTAVQRTAKNSILLSRQTRSQLRVTSLHGSLLCQPRPRFRIINWERANTLVSLMGQTFLGARGLQAGLSPPHPFSSQHKTEISSENCYSRYGQSGHPSKFNEKHDLPSPTRTKQDRSGLLLPHLPCKKWNLNTPLIRLFPM